MNNIYNFYVYVNNFRLLFSQLVIARHSRKN